MKPLLQIAIEPRDTSMCSFPVEDSITLWYNGMEIDVNVHGCDIKAVVESVENKFFLQFCQTKQGSVSWQKILGDIITQANIYLLTIAANQQTYLQQKGMYHVH